MCGELNPYMSRVHIDRDMEMMHRRRCEREPEEPDTEHDPLHHCWRWGGGRQQSQQELTEKPPKYLKGPGGSDPRIVSFAIPYGTGKEDPTL